MSHELSELVLGCGLEKGARRAILEAIAHFADNETGIARVSLVRLAQRAALAERTVYRVLPGLLEDPELAGLVRCVRTASGRGNAAVYKLDVGRLDPLVAAIRVAGRRVYAGVSKALQDGGLAGAKATGENITQIFRVIDGLLRSEGEFTAAQTVTALYAEYRAAIVRREQMAVVGRPMPGVSEGVDKGVEIDGFAGSGPVENEGRNPDILARNPDILTIAYNKDISPSGINPFTRDAREGCGKILVGAATQAGTFLFSIEGLIAHCAMSRAERHALLAELEGRVCRITRDSILAIRVRSDAEAEAMGARWLDRLLGWAGDVGLSGVVFDAEVRPPP